MNTTDHLQSLNYMNTTDHLQSLNYMNTTGHLQSLKITWTQPIIYNYSITCSLQEHNWSFTITQLHEHKRLFTITQLHALHFFLLDNPEFSLHPMGWVTALPKVVTMTGWWCKTNCTYSFIVFRSNKQCVNTILLSKDPYILHDLAKCKKTRTINTKYGQAQRSNKSCNNKDEYLKCNVYGFSLGIRVCVWP